MRRFFYNLSSHLNSDLLSSGNSDAHVNLESVHGPQSPNNPNLAGGLKDLEVDATFELPADVYHHWCRVLRAKIGDKSILFDGKGGGVVVQLDSIDKKTASARVISHQTLDNTSPYYSTVAIGISRGDRMDYAIQKTTELGATYIQLLTSQHGEVKLKSSQLAKKLNHWQQIALSASEQCGLNRPSLVLSPVPLLSYLKGMVGKPHDSVQYLFTSSFYQAHFDQSPLRLVLAVPSQEEQLTVDVNKQISDHLNQVPNPTLRRPRIDILIGAEGGLSAEEYQVSRQMGYLPWQLGNRVLRTETAPVVALATLNHISSLSSNC